jgi:hypothetical protein
MFVFSASSRIECRGEQRLARRDPCHAQEAPMAFAQNIFRNRRKRVHGRARCHGRCLWPGRVAVEHASPSSRCDENDFVTGADGQRHAVAESHAITESHANVSRCCSCCCGGGGPGAYGDRPSNGAAIGSSGAGAYGYPADADRHPAVADASTYGDSHRRSDGDPHRCSLTDR